MWRSAISTTVHVCAGHCGKMEAIIKRFYQEFLLESNNYKWLIIADDDTLLRSYFNVLNLPVNLLQKNIFSFRYHNYRPKYWWSFIINFGGLAPKDVLNTVLVDLAVPHFSQLYSNIFSMFPPVQCASVAKVTKVLQLVPPHSPW